MSDPAWQSKLFDGRLTTAYEVTAKRFPHGMDITVIDGVRALLHTADGLTEIQVGDWIACLPDGTLVRLTYDEAVRRLT